MKKIMDINFIKRPLYIGIFLLIGGYSWGQVRIANNNNNPSAANSSAFIDASSTNSYNITTNVGKGLLYPRTDLRAFTAFGGVSGNGDNPPANNYPTRYDGMMVYNIATTGVAGVGQTEGTLCRGFWYYDNPGTTLNGGTWRPLRPCSNSGTVTTLNCTSAVFSPSTLTQGVPYTGTMSVPYTGGNGGTYAQSSFTQNGLTFTLPAGTLANGNGNLVYTVSGVPTNSGAMAIPVSFPGAASCNVNITVGSGNTVISLNCAAAVFSPSDMTQGVPYTGTMTIPYTGGNGAAYSSFSWTNNNGLSFTLPAGTLANGNGNLVYNISGTPINSGTMGIPSYFPISGTPICVVQKTVLAGTPRCGAYIAPGVFKEFMCHNLGANTSLDPFTPAAGIHGAKYQWGRVTPALTQAQDQANSGAIPGWNTTPAPDGSWSEGSKGPADPCPAGYRVPSGAQWQAVINNNANYRVGPWVSDNTNFGSGLHFGPKLMLPTVGLRNVVTGLLITPRGGNVAYWGGNANASWSGMLINYSNTSPGVANDMKRTWGVGVRCIKE